MEKRTLKFKYDVEYKGVKYKSGEVRELEMMPHEFNALTGMGCIYAEKVAKYEEKPIEPVLEEKPKRGRKKKVKEDVDSKDIESTKLQAHDTIKE